jgi:hypothetical protein
MKPFLIALCFFLPAFCMQPLQAQGGLQICQDFFVLTKPGRQTLFTYRYQGKDYALPCRLRSDTVLIGKARIYPLPNAYLKFELNDIGLVFKEFVFPGETSRELKSIQPYDIRILSICRPATAAEKRETYRK